MLPELGSQGGGDLGNARKKTFFCRWPLPLDVKIIKLYIHKRLKYHRPRPFKAISVVRHRIQQGLSWNLWAKDITNCLSEKEFIIIMVHRVSARRSLVERRIGQKVSYLTRSEQDRLTSGPNVLLGFLKDRETGFWEQELIRFGWGVVSRHCLYNFAVFLLHQVNKLIVNLICMFGIGKIFKTLSEGLVLHGLLALAVSSCLLSVFHFSFFEQA